MLWGMIRESSILNSGSATATVDRDEEDNAISRRANLTTAAFQSELRYK